jgi:23S rRNA (pseudouridine1915-N3)-methyltransferase
MLTLSMVANRSGFDKSVAIFCSLRFLATMLIRILAVGRTKSSYWQLAQEDFQARLRRYSRVEDVFVKDIPAKSASGEEGVRNAEGRELLKKIRKDEYVIALDSRGAQLSSEEFASFLAEKTVQSISRFVFVIGGPLGLSGDVLSRADYVLALSKMTFVHEMARTILLEQIYRAMTIIKGEKYHK